MKKQFLRVINFFAVIRKTLKFVYIYDKKDLFLVFVVTMLLGGFSISAINIFGNIINAAENKNMYYVIFFIALQGVIALSVSFMESLKKYISQKLQTNLSYLMSCDVMHHCTKLSLKEFEDFHVKDNLKYIQTEMYMKPYQLVDALFAIFTGFFTVLFAFAVVIVQKPIAILIMIIPVTFSFFSFVKLSRCQTQSEKDKSIYGRRSIYMNFLLTDAESYKEIKLFNLADYVLNKYKKIEQKSIQTLMNVARKERNISMFTNTIKQLAVGLVSFIIFYPVVVNDMKIGVCVNLFNTVTAFNTSMFSMLTNFYMLHQSKLFMDKLFEFLKESRVYDGQCEKVDSIDSITIKNLNFVYPNTDKEVLHNVSISVKKGESVAILGLNGSGKSTLMKLILGLYDVPDQTILINGKCINRLSFSSMYKRMSALFQDFIRYELTVRENIGFGDIENIGRDDMIKAVIRDLDLGFVGELDDQLGLWFDDGKQLSGGQWQKVAIARALLSDADVYMLDEPSSSLDNINDMKIMKCFLEKSKDRIGIFITHKVRNAKFADKIIVMDKGEIVAYGTHKELLQSCELYKKFM